MQHCSIKRIVKFIFSLLLLQLFSAVNLYSQDFYWENPVAITKTDSRFPTTVTNGTKSYILWQDVDTSKKEIYISLRKYDSLTKFTENLKFAGPFSYSEEVPQIYSAAVSNKGLLGVAVLSEVSEITIYTSEDDGDTFYETTLSSNNVLISPRIYATKNNGFCLFVSDAREDAFALLFSQSNDGRRWPSLESFTSANRLRNPFMPVLLPVSIGDIVVFQALTFVEETQNWSYQLYSSLRFLGKTEWSTPKIITDAKSIPERSALSYSEYQNQNPYLHKFNNKYYMTWERSASNNSELWVAEINENGMIPNTSEAVAVNGSASRGILFDYEDTLYLTWFDTRRGNESIYLAKKNGFIWEEEGLVENRNSNMFVYPLLIDQEDKTPHLAFIWQQRNNSGKNVIGWLAPDKTVNKPDLRPLSFKKGKHSSNKNVEVQINFPEDSSNIAGYSYAWNYGEVKTPPKMLQKFTNEPRLKLKATSDGEHFLSVRVQDYAGNWSEPAELVYNYDITPPAAPEILVSEQTDNYGFAKSNTFSLKWTESTDDDVAGYTYRLDYLGNIPKSLAHSKTKPIRLSEGDVTLALEKLKEKYSSELTRKRKMSDKVMTSSTVSRRFYNRANGVYVFSVAAIDDVGNVSEAASQLIFLNKYIPSTFISTVEQKRNELGGMSLEISGGGFLYDGTISEIYIDADGKKPYDVVIKKAESNYKVVSDSKITNVDFDVDLDEGKYKIGLLHTDRGLYMSDNILKIDQNGTVKIEGEYQRQPDLSSDFKNYKYVISVSIIILAICAFIVLISIIVILISIKNSVKQEAFANKQAKSIVIGEIMPSKMLKKRDHLPSLKHKLVRFTYILIIIVVLMVMLMNAYRIIKLQETTLAQGVQNRAEVLLESVSTGVKSFLPTGQTVELSALPAQKDAMPEVKYITIIGQERDSTSAENLNYIWATNDPEIADKSDDYLYANGESQIIDEIIKSISARIGEYDSIISSQVAQKSERVNQLLQQQMEMAAQGYDVESEEMASLSSTESELRTSIDAELREFAKSKSGSYPYFDPDNFNYQIKDYIFYRPVLYRQGNSGNYIHGIVYLELSTKTLIDSIKSEALKIILIGAMIAIAALVFGIIGSNIFASIIIKPIKELENHVTLIGRTKQKKDLKGKDIAIKTKDEIERLGNAVNNMTHALIENEIEQTLLMDGSIVQNALLPLVPGTTYSDYSDDWIKCFGYYQAQTGVSGDFFDYRKLDSDWYAFIKSDASGHGAPAALIATIVATIYCKYFENWSFKKDGTKVNVVVEQINDFISHLGLRGKFATLLVGLFNKKNGDLYLCNAGDNIVHIYEKASQKVKTITLANLPTAGVFDTDMINMRGGYVVEKQHLDHGDVLFLYTDGIEESTRRMRFPDFTVQQSEKTVTQRNPDTGKAEEITKKEDIKEEFGPERVQQVIEAVFNKQKYILTKEENPMKNEVLEFDFTNCEGSLNDVIFALASLEKVFRLYKPQGLHRGVDFIRIDRNIDEFLSKYFNRYELYSKYKAESKDGPNYIDYEHMKEDEQSDDLTMLALKRI